MIKVGCCGFPTAKDEYYRHFPVAEVQQTFYQPPRLSTLEKWRAEAPSGFEFTLKAWQLITHPARSPTYRRLREPVEDPDAAGSFQPTDTVRAGWERTRAAAGALGAAVVLFQCPASFTATDEHLANLRRFFRTIARDALTLVWEPRGDWPGALIGELCEELDLVHGVDPFRGLPVLGGRAYFRLHGRTGYRYRHDDSDLHRLAGWCGAYENGHVLFNNISMFEDALRFRNLLSSNHGKRS